MEKKAKGQGKRAGGVLLAKNDRERMSQLENEVSTRLHEMASITSRVLGRDLMPAASTTSVALVLRPEVPNEQRLMFFGARPSNVRLEAARAVSGANYTLPDGGTVTVPWGAIYNFEDGI